MIRSVGELMIYQTNNLPGCDKSKLTDLNDTSVDTSLPVSERVANFIHQVGNPYLFKVGDTAVKIEFSGGSELVVSIARILNAG